MRSYFDLVQDKANEPYFSDAEKYQFLNAAQIDFINELIGGNKLELQSPLELDERALRILQPLIKYETGLSDTSGLLAFSGLASTFYGLLALEKADTSETHFYKWNDFNKASQNTYLTSQAGYRAIYTYIATGLKVSPTGQTDWTVAYIKEPVSIASGVDCELPASTHYMIVAKALGKAGIATESESLPAIEELTS